MSDGEFIKLAEARDKKRDVLRDLAMVGAGTAAGAGAGYGLGALVKHRYGEDIAKIDPNTRIKYLGPAATAVGAAGALVHVLRQRAEARMRQEKARDSKTRRK